MLQNWVICKPLVYRYEKFLNSWSLLNLNFHKNIWINSLPFNLADSIALFVATINSRKIDIFFYCCRFDVISIVENILKKICRYSSASIRMSWRYKCELKLIKTYSFPTTSYLPKKISFGVSSTFGYFKTLRQFLQTWESSVVDRIAEDFDASECLHSWIIVTTNALVQEKLQSLGGIIVLFLLLYENVNIGWVAAAAHLAAHSEKFGEWQFFNTELFLFGFFCLFFII